METYVEEPLAPTDGVAKGAYTEIVEIVAPASATPGNRVDITVRIKNNYSSTISIMARGALDYGVSPWPTITFPTYKANVGPGATYSFAGYFTMPDKAVTIHGYSYYYGVDGLWYFDDERTKNVALAEVPSPEFSGFAIEEYNTL